MVPSPDSPYESPYRHWSVFEKESSAPAWAKGGARYQQRWTMEGLPDWNWVTREQYDAALQQVIQHVVGASFKGAAELVPCPMPLPSHKVRSAMGFQADLRIQDMKDRRFRIVRLAGISSEEDGRPAVEDLMFFSRSRHPPNADLNFSEERNALLDELADLIEEQIEERGLPVTELHKRIGPAGSEIARLAIKRWRARRQGCAFHHEKFLLGLVRTSDGKFFPGYQPRKSER